MCKAEIRLNTLHTVAFLERKMEDIFLSLSGLIIGLAD